MSREEPHLRVVRPEDWTRRRRPGPALLFVLFYAVLFGAALWYLAARTGIWRKDVPAGRAASAASVVPAAKRSGRVAPSRDVLLSGEGVAEPAKENYFSRLATERCDCGCARTLSDCMVNEKSCSRSPALAQRVRETVNGKR